MFLIHRLNNFTWQNHKDKFISNLKENSANPIISNIIIFSSVPNISFNDINKVNTIFFIDSSDFNLIQFVLKRFRSGSKFIYANPFIKTNSSYSQLNQINECQKIGNDAYYFTNKSVINRFNKIEEILSSSIQNSKIVVEKINHWTDEIKYEEFTKSQQQIKEDTPSNILRRTGEIIEKTIKKLDIIIVSVDYNDYLLVSLLNNIKFCKNITVVTSEKDNLCHQICEKLGVKFIKTNSMFENGDKFNKGRAINDGIQSINDPDWILSLDADICLPDNFYDRINKLQLNKDTMYSSNRKICDSYEEYLKVKDGLQIDSHTEIAAGWGYFQLFNYSNFNKNRPYPESSENASKSDIRFKMLFSKTESLNLDTLHLGQTSINWWGRKSSSFLSKEDFNTLLKEEHYVSSSNEKSILVKSERDSNIVPKLAVITTFFNPQNYTNLKYNFKKFSEKIKGKCDLFTIELSFDGNFYIEGENCIRILGSEKNILWQKERLLNILLDKIPKDYTNIAWCDCDIIFESDNWIEECNKQLQFYKVVQLYEYANRLDDKNNVELVSKGIIKRISETNELELNLSNGVPGFGWAIRREVIDEIKFLDTQIIGGGDSLMYFSFFGKKNVFVSNQMNPEWFKHFEIWSDKAYKVVAGSVGFVRGNITHLYHGKMINRHYNDRYRILSSMNFNPSIHLKKDNNELWTFKNKNLNNKLSQYFQGRNEDDNVVDINNYFDKIFVLNLDRRPDKFEKVKSKLERLQINFERFSAIDGNEIDYELPKFRPGRGMIENKFALGCLMSHLEIVKISKNRGYKKILILEDDVLISKDIKILIQDIRTIPKWKILYFGSSQYDWNVEMHNDNFYLSKKCLGTFAYALDESIFDDFISSTEKKTKSVDNILSELQEKNYGDCYTFYPYLCAADVSDSEIRESRDNQSHSEKMKWNLLKYI